MSQLRSFGFLLKDVSRLSSKHFERQAAEAQLGLTLEQCKLLANLQRNEGINQKHLAYLSDMDQMTLVRLLDRMEKDGWVERCPDPQDRRVRRLRLKPAAQPILERIWAVGDQARSDAMAGLNASEREQLMRLLLRVHNNLAALVPCAIDVKRYQDDEPEVAARPSRSRPAATARRGKA